MKNFLFEDSKISRASMSNVKGGAKITDPEMSSKSADSVEVTDPELSGTDKSVKGIVGIAAGIAVGITDPEMDD